ncbi:MAG: hypothetical protein II841_08855 [Bacteroidales bacterium]|nr:hypothetical protein [Bacteroidales bacterium]
MISAVFTVQKAEVYNEVAKTTSYTGIKMSGDDYERIFTTDEDRMMLERFFNEAANNLTDLFKPFIVTVSDTSPLHCIDLERNYVVNLELSSSYDTNLNGSIQSSMFSFFTNFIVGSWYKFTNKGEAEGYLGTAASLLLDIKSKLYFRKKPRRIVPTE